LKDIHLPGGVEIIQIMKLLYFQTNLDCWNRRYKLEQARNKNKEQRMDEMRENRRKKK
jgi:hypothetical protein